MSSSRVYCMDPGVNDSDQDGDTERAPLLSSSGSGRSVSASPCRRAVDTLQDVGNNHESGTSLRSILPRSGSHALTRTSSPHCHIAGEREDQYSSLRKARRTLILAAGLCLLFTIAEAAGRCCHLAYTYVLL